MLLIKNKKTMATKAEQKHMQKVVELGCLVCRKLGYFDTPAEIHHIKNNTGMGRKENNFCVIPLCANHHRNSNLSYHHSPKAFTKEWGSQEDLLKETLELLQKAE